MRAFILLSLLLLRFAITRTLYYGEAVPYILQNEMFVSGAQYLQSIRHCPISYLSLLCVFGK